VTVTRSRPLFGRHRLCLLAYPGRVLSAAFVGY